MGKTLINVGLTIIIVSVSLIGIILIGFVMRIGSMKKKFIALGTLKGLSYAQIAAAVGKDANSIQHVPDGSIRVWHSLDYQITLLFDKKEKCLGVSNETAIL